MRERDNVELNLAETFFQGDLRKFAKHAVAGVVHQNVHGNAFALQLVEQKLRRRRSREVKRDGPGRNAKLALKFVSKLREPSCAAGDENNVVLIFGEELGQFVSDAAGRAGDESSLVFAGGFHRLPESKKAWGAGPCFRHTQKRVACPSRVLGERAGLLRDS